MDAMNQFQQQQQFQHHLQQQQLQHQQNMQASAFGMTPGVQSKFSSNFTLSYIVIIG